MFLYCCDNETEIQLKNKGYKLIKKHGNMAVFANNPSIKFDDNLSKKVMISDRITF